MEILERVVMFRVSVLFYVIIRIKCWTICNQDRGKLVVKYQVQISMSSTNAYGDFVLTVRSYFFISYVHHEFVAHQLLFLSTETCSLSCLS